jgi:hypothetical protein
LKRLAWSILLVLPLGAMADIYRSVDENGQVVYSDRPSSDAERITVSAAPAGAPAAAGASAGDGEQTDGDSTVFAEVPREPTPEELAADRARNCDYARQMLESYTTSHRLYRQGADGEREYLSAEEIDAARARAQSNVAAWCD